jgi:hypothetical protein
MTQVFVFAAQSLESGQLVLPIKASKDERGRAERLAKEMKAFLHRTYGVDLSATGVAYRVNKGGKREPSIFILLYPPQWKVRFSHRIIKDCLCKRNPDRRKASRQRYELIHRDCRSGRSTERDRRKADARSIVAIDCEGRDFSGNDIEPPYLNIVFPKRGSILWGASDGKRADWLSARGAPLCQHDILTWLCSLPSKYPKARFVSYGFGYDLATILIGASPRKIADIVRPKGHAPTVLGDFKIKYRKGKWLKIWKLKDREKPFGATSAFIQIDDIFGYWQTGFLKVCEPLRDRGLLSRKRFELIERGKMRRAEFDKWPLSKVKVYCKAELEAMVIAATQLRNGLIQSGSRMPDLSGPGTDVSALMHNHHVMEHYGRGGESGYPANIRRAAHIAYTSARIELIKQGWTEDDVVFSYDLSSARPHALTTLPSMKDGTWKAHNKLSIKTVDEIEGFLSIKNVLSLFKITWKFPPILDEIPVPFYPFPYRTAEGRILYPPHGKTWACKRELSAALKWCKYFGVEGISIERCFEFLESDDTKPFAFLQTEYESRLAASQSGAFDVALAKKTAMNAIAGKLMQKNGENGKMPSTVNPFYAAAMCAETRARLIEAALKIPYSVIGFQTDCILSSEPLGIESEQPALGAWALKLKSRGGFFLSADVYRLFDDDEEKTRGFDTRNFTDRSGPCRYCTEGRAASMGSRKPGQRSINHTKTKTFRDGRSCFN